LGISWGAIKNGGQVRATTDFFRKPEISVSHKTDVISKRANNPAPATTPAGTAAAAEFGLGVLSRGRQ